MTRDELKKAVIAFMHDPQGNSGTMRPGEEALALLSDVCEELRLGRSAGTKFRLSPASDDSVTITWPSADGRDAGIMTPREAAFCAFALLGQGIPNIREARRWARDMEQLHSRLLP